MTVRRYFVTVTPGTATGYWNAMKSPMRARSSGSASVTSSPLKTIWPSVISSDGCPMIALASVDLPDPFGPIRAWISPLPTERSTPFRISLSSALTCRLLISRSDIGLRDFERGESSLTGLHHGQRGDAGLRDGQRVRAARELDELGQRRALKRRDDAALHAHPQELRGARVGSGALVRAGHTAWRRGGEALHRRDLTLERQDHLVHRDLLRRP